MTPAGDYGGRKEKGGLTKNAYVNMLTRKKSVRPMMYGRYRLTTNIFWAPLELLELTSAQKRVTAARGNSAGCGGGGATGG